MLRPFSLFTRSALVMVLLAFWPLPPAVAQDALRYSIVPYQAAMRLVQLHQPVADTFADQLQQPVKIVTAADFDTFKTRLRAGAYDIAFVQPVDYKFAVEAGYVPLARMNARFRAQVVALQDSPFESIQDLRDKVVAMPPKGTQACYAMGVLLREHGMSPNKDITLKPMRSHEACMHQVLLRKADACFTNDHGLATFSERFKVTFRTVAKVPVLRGPLFVAGPAVSAEQQDRLRQTVLGWGQTEPGRALLQQAGLQTFEPLLKADHDAYMSIKRCGEDAVVTDG
jgi:phosphonate transport system substrate-binding protein